MTTSAPAAAAITEAVHGRSARAFVRHFVEMVVAMLVGMAVLGACVSGIFFVAGHSGALDHVGVRAPLMATNMTIGMSLWMRHRGHGWMAVGEMGGAMFVPMLALLGPCLAGLMSGGALLLLMHVLMLPAMLLVMLRRPDEYARDHRYHLAVQS